MSFASRQSRITEYGDAKAANVAAFAAQEYGSKRSLHVFNVSQFQGQQPAHNEDSTNRAVRKHKIEATGKFKTLSK